MVGGEWGFREDFTSGSAQNAISKIWKKAGVFQVLSESGSAAVCINDRFPICSPFPSGYGILGSQLASWALSPKWNLSSQMGDLRQVTWIDWHPREAETKKLFFFSSLLFSLL